MEIFEYSKVSKIIKIWLSISLGLFYLSNLRIYGVSLIVHITHHWTITLLKMTNVTKILVLNAISENDAKIAYINRSGRRCTLLLFTCLEFAIYRCTYRFEHFFVTSPTWCYKVEALLHHKTLSRRNVTGFFGGYSFHYLKIIHTSKILLKVHTRDHP